RVCQRSGTRGCRLSLHRCDLRPVGALARCARRPARRARRCARARGVARRRQEPSACDLRGARRRAGVAPACDGRARRCQRKAAVGAQVCGHTRRTRHAPCARRRVARRLHRRLQTRGGRLARRAGRAPQDGGWAHARAALHEIYLTLRHTVPNFNWSEPRFAALYPIHPLVADVSAAVRFYAPTFAFLPFTASATMQALNRPVLSLILIDEVFDRTEDELRRAKDLQEAFAVYDELCTNGVAQFPALQRLQVRLVLKLLFILSLDGRGASARDLCAALLFHDEAAPQAAVQRIEAMLQQLSSLAPSGRLPARAQEGELHYRFQIGAASEFDAALTAAVERLDADEETLRRTLSEFARARFSDWPFADANAAAIELHLNWRGTSRRGRFAQQATDAVAH